MAFGAGWQVGKAADNSLVPEMMYADGSAVHPGYMMQLAWMGQGMRTGWNKPAVTLPTVPVPAAAFHELSGPLPAASA